MSKKMVKVVMYATAAGPDYLYSAGETVEVEQSLADAWVEAGVARLEKEEDGGTLRTRQTRAFVVEEETVAAPEQATGPRERGRGK